MIFIGSVIPSSPCIILYNCNRKTRWSPVPNLVILYGNGRDVPRELLRSELVSELTYWGSQTGDPPELSHCANSFMVQSVAAPDMPVLIGCGDWTEELKWRASL